VLAAKAASLEGSATSAGGRILRDAPQNNLPKEGC
jgi:hypothetical protein